MELIPRSMAAEIMSWVSDHAASTSGVILAPSISFSVSISARLLTVKCASSVPYAACLAPRSTKPGISASSRERLRTASQTISTNIRS